MTWDSTIKACADNAIQKLHAQHGETVYVLQVAANDSEDTEYQENIRLTENIFRLLGIVQRNPAPRTLLKFGRKEPVDLLLTFCNLQLQNAALQSGVSPSVWTPTGITPHQGDHVMYQGVRHQIVQVGSIIKAVTQWGQDVPTNSPVNGDDPSDMCGIPDPTEGDYTVTEDQTSSMLEMAVMAVISTAPNVNVTNTLSTEPLFVSIAAIDSGTVLQITCNANFPVELDGDPRYQLRVTGTLNGIMTVLATTIALADSTHINITLTDGAPATGTFVTATYTNQPNVPVITNGISLAGSFGAIEAKPTQLSVQY